MRKVFTILAVVAAVCLTTASTPKPASAQKAYLDVFIAKYGIKEAKTKKCGVCHGKSKKMRSDYAQALAKALGAKKVKDKSKIKAALEKVESEKCGNTTYGELLKGGKLPPPYKAK